MYVTAERFQQPPAGTPAAGEWLKRGLVFASTLADPRSVDAVTQRVSVYADFPPVYATQFGAGRVFGLTSTAYQQTPYTGGVRQTNKKSYVIRANPFGTGGGTFGRLFDKGDGTTLETRAWWDGTTITYSQAFDGAVGVWTVPWTTARVPFVLAVSHDQTLDSNVPIIMVNGVRLPVTTATPASGTRQVTTEPMIVGNRASDQLRNFDGWLADFLIFDSALTEGELRDLSFNPYQAWEPETLHVPLPVGVGIDLTGAAAAEATASGTMTQTTDQVLAGDAAAEATASGTMTQEIGLAGAAAAEATASGALGAGAIAIQDGYDRASVNLASSSVSGTGNSAVITIRPKMQYSEVAGFDAWLEPSARVVGVNGLHPTFKFDSYDATRGANNYWGAPWDSTRYPMYSYDRETWHYFTSKTVGATDITFSNGTTDFTGDTIYVGRSRQMSVEQVGAWIDSLEATYPTLIEPTTTCASFTPSGATGFSGQSFIADEFSAQTGAWGTIPITPFYAFQINDTSLTPYGGGAKRVAILASGVHGGEDHANYVLKAVIAELLGSSAAAQAIRRNYRILVYPLVNAPGRYGGGWRGSFTVGPLSEDDANRHFSDGQPVGLEIIDKPKAAMITDLGGATPKFGIDFHGAYDHRWEVFSNATASQGETFRARLEAVAGYTVFDGSAISSGSLSEYMRNVRGANPAFTYESGDPSTVSDAEITANAGYVVQVLNEQFAAEILGGAAAAEATATGSLGQEIPVAGAAAAEATASGTMSIQEPVPAALATMSITLDDMSSSITATALVSASITVTLDDMGVFVFGHNSEYVAPPSENSRLAMSSVGRMM